MTQIFSFVWDGFIVILSTLLPDSSGFPEVVTDAIATVFGYAFEFNQVFLFVDDMFVILALAIVFETVIFLYHAIRWVINLVRG